MLTWLRNLIRNWWAEMNRPMTKAEERLRNGYDEGAVRKEALSSLWKVDINVQENPNP